MKPHQFIGIVILLAFASASTGYGQQTAEQLYQSAIYKEEIQGELDAAIKIYETIIKQYPGNRSVIAKTYLHIGLCHEKLGNTEARKAYERILRDYADQSEPTKVARERLTALSLGGGGTTGRGEVGMHRIWKTEEGYNPIAGISEDGTIIIINKNGDLWIHNLLSGEEKQITHEASWVDWSFAYGTGSAYFSPDEKWIAYCWQNKSFNEIRLSAVDGSSNRVVHNGKDGRIMYVRGWMPDGRRILTTSYDLKEHLYQLYIISLEDNAFRKIGIPFSQQSTVWAFARCSPDGRYIAFSQEDDIYIVDIATGQKWVFVKNPAVDALCDWTPDGSGIVFLSDRSGTNDLYLLGIQNGKPKGEVQLLRRNFGDNGGFCINPDGKLYRIEQTGSGNAFTVTVDKQTGMLNGTPYLADINFPGVEGPMWSSDGKQFYYEVFRNMENEQLLFIREEETSQTREIVLKPKLNFWYRPLLSPDGGQFIVTGSDKEINFGIFIINRESGNVNPLVNITAYKSGDVVDPCQNWSPDGNSVFYKVRSPEKSEEFIIRRKDITSGEDKEIYRGFNTREMKISTDGNRFAYFRNDTATKSYVIGILDINSGKELELGRFTEYEAPNGVESCTWTPDGKYVLVDKQLNKGSELWRFPSDGGPGEKLHYFPENCYGFALNPSGDRMAFTRYQLNFELWVLENFLPK